MNRRPFLVAFQRFTLVALCVLVPISASAASHDPKKRCEVYKRPVDSERGYCPACVEEKNAKRLTEDRKIRMEAQARELQAEAARINREKEKQERAASIAKASAERERQKEAAKRGPAPTGLVIGKARYVTFEKWVADGGDPAEY